MRTEIIYEDNEIIVIYKPSGLATQTANITQADVVSELTGYLGKNAYLGVIHRLDQPVEGLLVFAKTPLAAKELSRQVSERDISKYYYAQVSVDTEQETGSKIVLENYLLKDGKSNTSKVITEQQAKQNPSAKKAKLAYQLLKQKDGIALIRIELFTGRHHQIRVQMTYAGMPLLGDTKYATETSALNSKKFSITQLSLCAYKLKFTHPKTKEEMQFEITPRNQTCFQ